MTRAFTIACVVTSAGQINQIQNSAVDTGLQEMLEYGDGKVDPEFVAVEMQSPRFAFTTTAIKKALDASGWSALALTTAMDVWFRAIAQGGFRTNTAACTKVTGTHGILVPRSIQADQRNATISYEALLRSNDGTTNPIAVAVSQNLPTLDVASQRYVAGPCKINGVAIDSVQSIGIDFGFAAFTEGSDGTPFPRFAAVQTRTPSIVITCFDVHLLDTYTVAGAAQGATDSVVYLRKVAADATRVAAATEEHISFTIDAGRISVRSLGGDHLGRTVVQVTITPISDATNDTLALDTTAAIA